VARVVVSNPQKTRAIAKAKVKTDKVDAAILAELLAANFLLSVWVADEQTHALRRQVARRANIVRQRTRLKNQVQAILSATSSRAARQPTCSGSRAAAGYQTSISLPTRSSRSTLCCAGSTFTLKSCGSSTPHSAGSRWNAKRCCTMLSLRRTQIAGITIFRTRYAFSEFEVPERLGPDGSRPTFDHGSSGCNAFRPGRMIQHGIGNRAEGRQCRRRHPGRRLTEAFNSERSV
jgi:Transposase